MLFCHVTTRIDGRENDDLLFEFDGDGTPYVCMIDGAGAVLGRHRGPHSLAGYERLRASITELLAARERLHARLEALAAPPVPGTVPQEVARAAAAAKEEVRLARIDADIAACVSGAMPFEELEFALEDRGVPSPDQQRRIAGLRADQRIEDLERSFRKTPRNAPAVVVDSLLDEVAGMHAEGNIPSRPDAAATFWLRLAQWAQGRGRPAVLEECVAALERLPADCRPDADLERLRAAAGG